jgi:hypothetical protein
MSAIPWTAIYPDGPPASGTSSEGGGAGSGNPAYPGLPEGATPRHVDVAVSGAGTWTLWQPAPGRRVVLLHVLVSADTAQRVAVVEGADVPGKRAMEAYVGASGGAAADLTPAPYVAATDAPLLLVTAGGNVVAQATGYEV